MGKFVNLTGKKFGRLTVVKRAEKGLFKTVRWLCKCDCGNETYVDSYSLTHGETTSCGCFHRECVAKQCTTHGKANTRLYSTWCNMKQRCYNPKNTEFDSYGGRGIIMCQEWQEFLPFYNWAMGNGYQDNLTIDRINNNGNYEPSNCRWINYKTQANNTRRNHLITYKNETKTMTEWAEIKNISYTFLRRRLNLGWSAEEALTIPKGGKRHA